MPTALQTLQELDEGRLLATLQNAFHDAAAAVKQHGKAATITVNATTVQGSTGEWGDNIPWRELQRIKREVGYGDRDAVEIFPADRDVVNVANMRHLWIVSKPIEFAWRWKP